MYGWRSKKKSITKLNSFLLKATAYKLSLSELSPSLSQAKTTNPRRPPLCPVADHAVSVRHSSGLLPTRSLARSISFFFSLSSVFLSLSLSNCHSQIMQAPLLEYLRPTVVQPPPSPRFVATSAAITRIGVLGKFLGVLG